MSATPAWSSGETARAFAAEWLAAWNAHDLSRILAHYDERIVFLSPLAQARTGNGRVEGRDALRRYWEGGLKAQPDLKFELEDVLVGHEAVTILYRNHRGQRVAESFEFNSAGHAVRAMACYGPASGR